MTMRLIKLAVVIIMLSFGIGIVYADNSSSIGGMEFVITSRSLKSCTLKTIKYIDEPIVVVPDSVEIDGSKYCVTSLSKGVFCDFELKDQIKSVVLPKGIIELSSKAFAGCESMESITLPKSLKKIGDSAFYGCSSLKSVDLPVGLTTIGEWAFSDCSSFASITIPMGIIALEPKTFDGCRSLTTVNFALPSKLQRIDAFAFSNCVSLTSIKIPKSCKTMSLDAFYGSALKSLYIGRNTQFVDDSLPEGCQVHYY